MESNAKGTSAPSILPTRINWVYFRGVVLHYERVTKEVLVSSGLIAPDEIPETPKNRAKNSRNGALRVNLAKGGTYNASIYANEVLSRNLPFKKFLGGLLADTDLSLVRGESA